MNGYQPDAAAIKADVAALSAMRRSSARAGERESAAWLAGRLRELGIADVEVEPYRYQRSYALAHALHNLAGVAACALGGLRGAAFALATLASYEREVSGASQWLRALLTAGGNLIASLPGPASIDGEGANVVARIPSAAGDPRATLVLVAHHDAANTGLVWNPRIVAIGAARHLRRRRVDPFMAPLELGFALVAAGALLPRRSAVGRRTRTAAAAALVLATAAEADIARAETVPGASDNATGVAACLDLARAIAANPLEQLDVTIALTGSEEAGMGGMAAFLKRHSDSLDAGSVFILGLDTLGAGTPIVCSGEGAMREQRYREPDLRLLEEGAALAGLEAPARWRLGGWTDPILAVHRGLPAASLLSMGPGYFPHYHHKTDTSENVDWGSVARCARMAGGVIAAYAGRVATGRRW